MNERSLSAFMSGAPISTSSGSWHTKSPPSNKLAIHDTRFSGFCVSDQKYIMKISTSETQSTQAFVVFIFGLWIFATDHCYYYYFQTFWVLKKFINKI